MSLFWNATYHFRSMFYTCSFLSSYVRHVLSFLAYLVSLFHVFFLCVLRFKYELFVWVCDSEATLVGVFFACVVFCYLLWGVYVCERGGR